MNLRRTLQVCLLISPVLLGGCTLLPVSFQVASMALDGISLVTTQKSLTDHGISALTQKDCALWRGVTDQDVCQDVDVSVETALATPAISAQPSISSPYLNVI